VRRKGGIHFAHQKCPREKSSRDGSGRCALHLPLLGWLVGPQRGPPLRYTPFPHPFRPRERARARCEGQQPGQGRHGKCLAQQPGSAWWRCARSLSSSCGLNIPARHMCTALPPSRCAPRPVSTGSSPKTDRASAVSANRCQISRFSGVRDELRCAQSHSPAHWFVGDTLSRSQHQIAPRCCAGLLQTAPPGPRSPRI